MTKHKPLTQYIQIGPQRYPIDTGKERKAALEAMKKSGIEGGRIREEYVELNDEGVETIVTVVTEQFLFDPDSEFAKSSPRP